MRRTRHPRPRAWTATSPRSDLDLPDHVELAPGLLLLRPQPPGEHDPAYRSAWTQYKQTVRRRAVIDLLGNACHWCGWVGHVGAYHVHHLDPANKTRSDGRGGTRFTAAGTSRAWLTEEEKAELQTCILLCANCHHTESVGSHNEYLKYTNINTGAYGSWEEIEWTSSR